MRGSGGAILDSYPPPARPLPDPEETHQALLTLRGTEQGRPSADSWYEQTTSTMIATDTSGICVLMNISTDANLRSEATGSYGVNNASQRLLSDGKKKLDELAKTADNKKSDD